VPDQSFWLLKSEPDEFSVDDLRARPASTEPWSGVRNFQARNYLRAMKRGDLAFFYHSSCPEPGVVGIVEIVKEAYPDPTQFDPKGDYFDARAKRDAPKWFCVDVRFKKKLELIPLTALRASTSLAGLKLLAPGSRLSVLPVSEAHWRRICAMAAK
jgi:predicted RNA-binding protein with PUA-like domain